MKFPMLFEGDMTAAEVSQCALDIKSWFIRNKASKFLNESATSADIQRLEKSLDCTLPRELKILLQEVNGCMFLKEKRQFSSEEIQENFGNLEKEKKWKDGLIPFAGDDSSYLVIDTRKSDEIYEWDADDGFGDSISASLGDFLEKYRDDLLKGHYEFLGEAGVVEKMSRGKK